MSATKKGETIYLPCNPDVFGGLTTFPVTLFRPKVYIRPAVKISRPHTLGTQVDEILQEWYAAKGLPVPPEEQNLAQSIDAVQAAEEKRMDDLYAAAAAAQLVGEKPEFGTPQFWAWARARKAEKDKEREQKGLPPLPTKKEKEEAKAVKDAEKAAKVAAKAAKVLAKAAKNSP